MKKKFCISESLQNEFVEALKNDSINSFHDKHLKNWKFLKACFKQTHLPSLRKKNGKNDQVYKLCKFIKNNFLNLLRGKEAEKRDKKLIEGSYGQNFWQNFTFAMRTRDWESFFSQYMVHFNAIIQSARDQQIVNIVFLNGANSESFLLTDPKKVARTQTTESDDWSLRREKLDHSFRRRQHEQNEQFNERLRELRMERERLNREAEEELSRYREESRMRVLVFLRCVHLKLRWEEQANEWDQWMRTVRSPVLSVKNRFNGFGYQPVRRLWKDLEQQEIRSEIWRLQNSVRNAYNKLCDTFHEIRQLSEKFEDKLFLKVAQQKISSLATNLSLLLEELQIFELDVYNEEIYRKVKSLEKKVHPWDVPTSMSLRKVCESARMEDFDDVEPPRELPQSLTIIEEIDDV